MKSVDAGADEVSAVGAWFSRFLVFFIMFQSTLYSLRTGKTLAWFALGYGVFAILFPFFVIALTGAPLTDRQNLICYALGVTTMVAGFNGLAAKRWAYWVLFAAFVVQTVEYFSPHFFYSWSGPLTIKIALGSAIGHGSVDILAAVICVYALVLASTERR